MKNIKRSIAVFIVCLLLISCVPAVSAADDSLTYGDFKYTVNNGEVTVTEYIGEDANMVIPSEIEGMPVRRIGSYAFSNNKTFTSAKISDSVTDIGNDAFEKTSLESIVVPDSVTLIGIGAFKECEKLKTAVIPENIKQLPSKLFEECTKLETVKVGKNVTSFGDKAFSRCYKLKKVNIPDTVTYFGEECFNECLLLESVTIPYGAVTIKKEAFRNCCGIKKLTIPDSVTSIEQSAFADCVGLKELSLGAGVKTIGQTAFSHCKALTSLEIPDNIAFMGIQSFGYCESLTNIKLGDGLKAVNNGVFIGCSSLKSIVLPSGIETVYAKAFVGCTALSHIYFSKSIKSIQDKSIGYYYPDYINDYNNLQKISTKLTIHGYSGTAAESYAKANGFTFAEFGGYYPGANTAIELDTDYLEVRKGRTGTLEFSVDLPAEKTKFQSSNEKIATVDENGVVTGVRVGTARIAIINGNATAVVTVDVTVPPVDTKKEQTYGNGVKFFYIDNKDLSITVKITGCEKSVTDVIIPSKINGYKVTAIGKAAFKNNTKIRRVVISENVKTMGASAFYGCTVLKSVSFPKSLKTIGYGAFKSCNNISAIYIKSIESWSNITNSYYYDLNHIMLPTACKKKVYVDGKLLRELTLSGDTGAFKYPLFMNCTSLKRVVVSEGVREIAQYAFSGCSSLEEIVLPDSLTKLKYNSFADCTSLKRVTVPKNIKRIDSSTFDGCTALSVIDYKANSCTDFGDKRYPAFGGCSSLKRIVIDSSVNDIAYYIFNNAPANLEIVGEKGSYAEEFAEENSYSFTELGSEEPMEFKPVGELNEKLAYTEDYLAAEPNVYSKELKAGGSFKLSVKNGQVVSYSSSNKKIATVKNGKVTALKKGSAVISAKLRNGIILKTSITIKTSPKLSKASLTLGHGKTKTVKITGKASAVNNKYQNTKIAKITSKPTAASLKIQGVKKGKTTLYITVNGVKLKLKVNVK